MGGVSDGLIVRTVGSIRLPAPAERWSRILCQRGGPLAVVLLESGAARGPWAVVDWTTGDVAVGRALSPISDGLVEPDAAGLLLTHNGLTRITVSPGPRVLGHAGAGLSRGKDQEQVLARLSAGVVMVGRRQRRSSKIVDVGTGEVLGTTRAMPPFLVLPTTRTDLGANPGPDQDHVTVWALGSGELVRIDLTAGRVTARTPAPEGIAAVRTDAGLVALLAGVDHSREETLLHAALRDVAVGPLHKRLPSPYYTDLRLARLDDDLREVAVVRPSWLLREVPDPDWWGAASLSLDGTGRLVLSTVHGLHLVDTASLTRVGSFRTDWAFPSVWPGTCSGIVRSQDGGVALLDWSAPGS